MVVVTKHLWLNYDKDTYLLIPHQCVLECSPSLSLRLWWQLAKQCGWTVDLLSDSYLQQWGLSGMSFHYSHIFYNKWPEIFSRYIREKYSTKLFWRNIREKYLGEIFSINIQEKYSSDLFFFQLAVQIFGTKIRGQYSIINGLEIFLRNVQWTYIQV